MVYYPKYFSLFCIFFPFDSRVYRGKCKETRYPRFVDDDYYERVATNRNYSRVYENLILFEDTSQSAGNGRMGLLSFDVDKAIWGRCIGSEKVSTLCNYRLNYTIRFRLLYLYAYRNPTIQCKYYHPWNEVGLKSFFFFFLLWILFQKKIFSNN